jgi:AcrR family transcriptional regulator
MSKKKNASYHHGDLRNAMVQEALVLAKTHGARSVTLTQVSKRLKVSVAAPYRHFTDKEALLAAAAGHCFAELKTAIVEARAAEKKSEQRIYAVARNFVEFGRSHEERFELMFQMNFDETRFPEVTLGRQFVFQEILEDVALESTSVKAQTVALQIWCLLHGAALLQTANDKVVKSGIAALLSNT